jgi:hypothetical protein
MSVRRYRAPTPDQELLLQACFLDAPDAIAAWTQWSGHVDPGQLDDDSSRLLPMLYHALHKHGVSDPWMGRLKNVYRQTWVDNTLRFHLAATVLRALHEAGIQTMLLKGPALALRYYGDLGLRPMEDVDILVPTHQGPAALDILKGLGWTPAFECVGFTEGEALEVGHAYPFRKPRGQAVDLHWHVFYQRVTSNADSEFWAAACPVTLSGVSTQTLCPADHLLHVCVHAMERAWWGGERRPNLRWVADAMIILRNAAQELDWDRLLTQAQRLQFVLPMREALDYLHERVGAQIPATALARIRTLPVPLAERVAERARTRPSRQWGPWVALGVRYLEYCSTLPADAGLLRRLAGLPAFFRRQWGSAPGWTLLFAAIFRGVRRIRWVMERHRSDTTHSADR